MAAGTDWLAALALEGHADPASARLVAQVRAALAQRQPLRAQDPGPPAEEWLDLHTSGGPAPRRWRLRLHPRPDGRWSAWAQDVTAELENQARVRHLQAQLETVCRFGRMAVWERELPSGRGRWDDNAFRLFGFDPAERTPDFLEAAARVHPDDRLDEQFLESLRRPGDHQARYRVQLPDGTERVLRSQWTVTADRGGEPRRVLGVMNDETELEALSQGLGLTAEQLKLAVETAGVGLWVHDLSSGRIHYNDELYRMLGQERSVDGLPIEEARALVHPDDLPRVLESARRSLETGEPADFEARYVRRDGQYRHVFSRRVLRRDPSGRPVSFIGVSLDVTEQVNARELQARLEQIVAAAGVGVWRRHLETDAVEWNGEMYRMYGWPADQPPPSHARWWKLVHPDDRPALRRAVARARAEAGTSVASSLRVRRADGEWRWFEQRICCNPGSGGPFMSGVTLDITDRMRSEEVREEREAALRASQAKSDFLARMSHELRTPLNAVLGFTELLQQEMGDAPIAQRAKLAHVRDAGEHLLALINDVLDLSRLESGSVTMQPRAVPIGRAIAEALPLVDGLARSRGVRWSLPSGEPAAATVHADPTRLRQVLVNLLSNAVKYNREAGEVRIGVEGDRARVSVWIEDDGPGIPREWLPRLFEPFDRLHAQAQGIEGTGIGLVVVKALCEAMGGEVRIDSEPGRGTRATFCLPAAPQAPAPAAARTPPAGPVKASHPGAPATTAKTVRPGRGHVLYIEDNPVNVLLMTELIHARSDLTLSIATTGEEGIAAARATRPDLVLVDMQLPDLNGDCVLARLRNEPSTRGLPCVALSANAMRDDIERALALGFEDYWTKPIDFDGLIASLARRFPPA